MPKAKEPLYIGIGGHVVAIDRATGEERWRRKLRSSSFITIAVEAGAVYAGAQGELFCLDPKTGSILWHNRLKGLGHNLIAFGGSSTTAITASAIASQAAAIVAASSAASAT